jgi:tRNA threonylcarbamoyl adenosine modification protein (Sua5/YciO/YrdC/YwlC family)
MIIRIHPQNPQARLIRQAADIIISGGIIAFPTDSAYALGCSLENKAALDKIRAIRKLPEHHNFTLMCANLSDLSVYAKVDNVAFRLIKNTTPGPYTFILGATREVPRRLQHPKRKTVGLRLPDNRIAQAIIEEVGEPIMTVSLIMPEDTVVLNDPEDIEDKLKKRIDGVIDGGVLDTEPTTVIRLDDDVPTVVRQGKGTVDFL